MKVSFTGDIFIGYCNEYILPRIDKYVTANEYRIANLEAPITTRNHPISKKGPVMAQPAEVVDFLNKLGVTHVNLANNHIADHGWQGVEDTLETLDKSSFGYAGAGLSPEEIFKPIRVYDGNSFVSILSCAENGFGCYSTEPAEQDWGYAWLYHPEFQKLLHDELNKASSVILSIHAGAENVDRPLPQWRKTYKQFINLGVSAIIAHHPHVTQGVEVYKGAPIFYSIGNFFFYKDKTKNEKWYQSQIPELTFKEAKLKGWEVYHSHFSQKDGGSITYDNKTGPKRTQKLSEQLVDEDTYNKVLQEDLEWLWKSRYGPGIERSLPFSITNTKTLLGYAKNLSAYLLGKRHKDPMVFEHYCDIESHRWTLAEIMRRV